MPDGFDWNGPDVQLIIGGTEFTGKVRVTFTPDQEVRRAYSRERVGQYSIGDNDGGILEVEFLRTALESLTAWDKKSTETLSGPGVPGTVKNIKLNIGYAFEYCKLLPRNFVDDEGGDTFTVRAHVLHAKPTSG